MCWISPDCLSGCKHRTVRNADGKRARAQRKPGSRAGRNNVTVRGDMRSKCRAYIRCFDRSYIGEYKPIEPPFIFSKAMIIDRKIESFSSSMV